MKKSVSSYPIGSTWKAINENGKVGKIWLEERNEFFEVWKWSVAFIDGSGFQSDWSTSYRLCQKEIPIWNYHGTKPLRFKRVKL